MTASSPNAVAPEGSAASERSVTLNGQRLPKRAAIVAAGPIANFVFSILILSVLAYVYGVASAPPRIETVGPDSPAQRAGFEKGDVVKSIDGRTVDNFAQIIDAVSFKADEAMTFVVERNGVEVTLSATPASTVIATPIGSQRVGRLGLGATTDPNDYRTIYLSPAAALAEGTSQTWSLVVRTGEYLARVVIGRASTDQLSGPIRIAQISSAVSLLGFGALLNLTAMLSVSLGLMNFLPVPMLDGGHLMFYAIEAVRRKQISRRAQEVSLRIGLGLVAALTIFVTVNDLWRLVRA